VTLQTHKTGDKLSTKHISNETSLSDHRYILFQVSVLKISNQLGILLGRLKGQCRGCTQSFVLGAEC
jgi:hypothetical protein